MRSNINKVETVCNFCGSANRSLVTQGREHEYDNTTDDLFAVVACRDCGLVYLSPRPDVSELDTIYPPNYYSYGQQKLKEEADPNSLLHRIRYHGFKVKIQRALSLCPGVEPVTVLDIGCGDGHTLNLFRTFGPVKVETHGVDFNVASVEAAASCGHKTYTGRFEEVDLAGGYFDLVYASHVIEHVADPRGFTEKVQRILKPGGIFWFETPNIGSLDARLFRRKHWGAYHFPRHWFFFSPETILKLARLAGFDVVLIDYVPNAIFWFWTCHSLIVSANPKLRKLADALFPPVDFQRDTLANFLRICLFCSIDLLIKVCTGQTANMIVAFRKPVSTNKS